MDKEKLILDGGTIEEINAEMREFLDLDNDELYGDVQLETETINDKIPKDT